MKKSYSPVQCFRIYFFCLYQREELALQYLPIGVNKVSGIENKILKNWLVYYINFTYKAKGSVRPTLHAEPKPSNANVIKFRG